MQMEAPTGFDFIPLTSLLFLHFVASYSLTVFSPSGKLVQIEHALAAVSQGTTSLGIKGTRSPLSCISQVKSTVQRPMGLLSQPRRSHPQS